MNGGSALEGAYRPFDPHGSCSVGATGWDSWAEEYAQLPRVNAAYRLSKRLLHDVVESETAGRPGLDVLDFNCGCGNDFHYFLDAGHRVVGCDGSAGMLAVAARLHPGALDSGALALFQGRAELLTRDAFGDRRFDVVFSATGGTAYLPDAELRRVHEAFVQLLKPKGMLLITHLRPRCLAESLYYLAHARPRMALRRWRSRLEVSIKSEALTMYLRTPDDLRRIVSDLAPADRLVGLNVVTPPFQTGVRLPERLGTVLHSVERRLGASRAGLAVCDQFVRITRAPG